MRNLRRVGWWMWTWALVICPLAASRAAEHPPEIVVAIRYLQGTGTSHSHLFLYREDGKLLRQLTKDDGGQDRNPVFQPDGENIVFTRELPGGATQWWIVSPRGENLKQLAAAPDWYAGAKTSPSFVDLPPQGGAAVRPGSRPGAPVVPPPGTTRNYRAPDGSAELVIDHPGAASGAEADGRGFLLRDPKTGEETRLGDLPGFEPLQDLLTCQPDAGDQNFLLEDSLRVAFFSTHLNSTDGSTVHALDLAGQRVVRLSPNGATPFPLPGEAGFLALTEERYVPFGDGQHTANCSYVDHWDAGLQRVRYAREKAPATCDGASMYRAGKTPAVVTVLGTGEE